MTIFVNLYGGPGAGKSTTAAGVFYNLKSLGVNCELVPEFAKDLVWEGRVETLKKQFYVSARQFYMISKLENKADVVVTDSPVLLGAAYTADYPKFYHDSLAWHNEKVSTEGFNFFLRRSKAFSSEGRVHNEGESLNLDEKIKMVLLQYDIDYECLDTHTAARTIANRIMEKLNG